MTAPLGKKEGIVKDLFETGNFVKQPQLKGEVDRLIKELSKAKLKKSNVNKPIINKGSFSKAVDLKKRRGFLQKIVDMFKYKIIKKTEFNKAKKMIIDKCKIFDTAEVKAKAKADAKADAKAAAKTAAKTAADADASKKRTDSRESKKAEVKKTHRNLETQSKKLESALVKLKTLRDRCEEYSTSLGRMTKKYENYDKFDEIKQFMKEEFQIELDRQNMEKAQEYLGRRLTEFSTMYDKLTKTSDIAKKSVLDIETKISKLEGKKKTFNNRIKSIKDDFKQLEVILSKDLFSINRLASFVAGYPGLKKIEEEEMVEEKAVEQKEEEPEVEEDEILPAVVEPTKVDETKEKKPLEEINEYLRGRNCAVFEPIFEAIAGFGTIESVDTSTGKCIITLKDNQVVKKWIPSKTVTGGTIAHIGPKIVFTAEKDKLTFEEGYNTFIKKKIAGFTLKEPIQAQILSMEVKGKEIIIFGRGTVKILGRQITKEASVPGIFSDFTKFLEHAKDYKGDPKAFLEVKIADPAGMKRIIDEIESK